MPQVFVAAGSNVEPERHLALASDELCRIFGEVQFSPWYSNGAVGFEGEDFINFVVGFQTTLSLPDLVEQLRQIEALCGRPPGAPKWAPRSMDLDILLYDDVVDATYRLPRPDLLKRPYMLGPLADIAPDHRHPTAHVTIGELWKQFDQGAHPMQPMDTLVSRRFCRRPPEESGR